MSKEVEQIVGAATPMQHEEFIQAVVDGMVASTGMPAVGFALVESGLISKNGLKKMVRKGKLKMIQVTFGQGHVNAYYTDKIIPALLTDKEEKADDTGREQLGDNQPAGDTSEGLPGRPLDTKDAQVYDEIDRPVEAVRKAFGIEEGGAAEEARQRWGIEDYAKDHQEARNEE